LSSDINEMPMKLMPQDETNMDICRLNDPDLYIPNIEPPEFINFKYDPDVGIEMQIWREQMIEQYENNLRYELELDRMSNVESTEIGLNYKDDFQNDDLEKTYDTSFKDIQRRQRPCINDNPTNTERRAIMNGNYHRRKNRRRAVENIIMTLKEILAAEEFYQNSLPAHPSFEDQVIESDYTLFVIDEALNNLRNAYQS